VIPSGAWRACPALRLQNKPVFLTEVFPPLKTGKNVRFLLD
jgi:hypothetical protein